MKLVAAGLVQLQVVVPIRGTARLVQENAMVVMVVGSGGAVVVVMCGVWWMTPQQNLVSLTMIATAGYLTVPRAQHLAHAQSRSNQCWRDLQKELTVARARAPHCVVEDCSLCLLEYRRRLEKHRHDSGARRWPARVQAQRRSPRLLPSRGIGLLFS